MSLVSLRLINWYKRISVQKIRRFVATINLPNEGDFPWDLNPAITAINSDVETLKTLTADGRLSEDHISGEIAGVVNTVAIPSTQKGAVNGVASLDSSGDVPYAQLPNALSPSGISTAIGADTQASTSISAPAFIAAENLRAKDRIVVGSYYGPFSPSGSIIQSQTAITNAIDAATQQGGGTVVIPYTAQYEPRADQIVLPRWVHLTGAGWSTFGDRASRLRQNAGVNDDFIIVDSNGVSGTRPFIGPLSISDIALLGHPTSTAGHGISIRTPDGRKGIVQDMTAFERLLLGYFGGSGFYANGASPLIMTNIVTLWNRGHGIELVDLGTDPNNRDIHHVSLEDISGDGNMGYQTDAYGATVHIQGAREGFGMTLRGIKNEYRPLPDFMGGDGVRMGNRHGVIIEDSDNDIDITGITQIATGSQTRRPDVPILVKGSRRPNLSWSAAGIRGAHAFQTGPVTKDRVRDETVTPARSYARGFGTLGPLAEADTAATALRRTAYKSGWYISPGNATGTATPVEARLYFVAAEIAKVGGGIDRLVSEVTVAGTAGAVIRMGVYAANDDGLPGALLAESDPIPATATGKLTATVNVQVPSGKVFLAAVCQGTATTRPTMRSVSEHGNQTLTDSDNAVSFAYSAYFQDTVTGALPAAAGAVGATGTPIKVAARLT